jgi:Replication-relaxation
MNRGYVTTSRLMQLARTLSAREQAVLSTVARVRLATGGQLRRLHYGDVSARQTRAALATLTERRLLARLPRVIGGVRAGSAGFVYALDVAGQRLALPGDRRRQRPWTPGVAFLAHTLQITELYARLAEAERTGRLVLEDFATEPACWRSFHGLGGGRLVLKPDAAITVRLGGFVDRWFIEVDRGTEATTTIARKADLYRLYWGSGREQADTGVFPLVLWLVPDEHRHGQLVEALGHQPGESSGLFVVSLFDAAVERIAAGATP